MVVVVCYFHYMYFIVTIRRIEHTLWMLNNIMSSIDICYSLDVKPPYILNILTCNRDCYSNKLVVTLIRHSYPLILMDKE